MHATAMLRGHIARDAATTYRDGAPACVDGCAIGGCVAFDAAAAYRDGSAPGVDRAAVPKVDGARKRGPGRNREVAIVSDHGARRRKAAAVKRDVLQLERAVVGEHISAGKARFARDGIGAAACRGKCHVEIVGDLRRVACGLEIIAEHLNRIDGIGIVVLDPLNGSRQRGEGHVTDLADGD